MSKLRISSIGLLTVVKEPKQDHKDHPTYNRERIFRISSIGLLGVCKEPQQDHKPHPTYNYERIFRISSLGFLTESALEQRVERAFIVRRNHEVIE